MIVIWLNRTAEDLSFEYLLSCTGAELSLIRLENKVIHFAKFVSGESSVIWLGFAAAFVQLLKITCNKNVNWTVSTAILCVCDVFIRGEVSLASSPVYCESVSLLTCALNLKCKLVSIWADWFHFIQVTVLTPSLMSSVRHVFRVGNVLTKHIPSMRFSPEGESGCTAFLHNFLKSIKCCFPPRWYWSF